MKVVSNLNPFIVSDKKVEYYIYKEKPSLLLREGTHWTEYTIKEDLTLSMFIKDNQTLDIWPRILKVLKYWKHYEEFIKNLS